MVPKQICRLLPALVAGAAVVMLSFERSSEGKIRIAMPAVPAAAAGPGGRAAADKNKAGLHIPQGRQVSFTYTLNDGGGYRWDIQYYGTIGQGTNYAYSGGLYCQINGSNIHSSGRGWINQAGDEVEIGPYSRSNLRIYRRIKVYKDRGLARWLDIFENPTGAPITVGVNIYSNTNWQVGNRIFSSGKGSFTEEDTSFVTRTQGGNAPAVFHYVCGKKSKVRPTIDIRSNQIYVRWNLTIPAGKSIVLCYFESQNNSITDLTKLMGSFKPDKVMKDLPASVRKLIVNIPARRGIGGVELERIESADTVFNKNGDPVYGTITDKTFGVETLFGKMDVPADQVIGMASSGGEDERLRIALTGGQVIAGRLADDDKIHLELPSGGALNVPFADVQQWSYRISKQRP